MTTRQVAQICGVTEECVRQNSKVIGVELGDRWHPHDWTEEELKKLQAMLMKNQTTRGNMTSDTVSNITQVNLGEGLAINVLSNSGDVEAMKEYCDMLIQKTQAQHELLLAQEQNKLLLEQKEQLQLDYQNEMEEHQKDRELVRHKYLTATQIKETVQKEYGKSIVVSKLVKRIPLEDNDILYKPFKNGNFTGQQPVYHPNVLDKIREILG